MDFISMNMKIKSILTFFVVFFCQELFGDDVGGFLPINKVFVADVMVAKSTDRIEEIGGKITSSIQANKDWFMQYVDKYPGAVLPYHKNLGVTEDEYKYFSENAKKSSVLSKFDEVEMRVEPLSSGKGVVLKTNPESFPLNGVSIYIDDDYVDTKYARLDKRSEINQDEKESISGRWKGVQWNYAEWDGKKGKSITLAIGRRTDFKDGILYFDVKDLLSDPHEVYYFILLYPL